MIKMVFLSVPLLLVQKIVVAQSEIRLKEYNLSKSFLAIEGYDPVAYFTANKAIEGNKKLNYTYEAVMYYFSTVKLTRWYRR